jgi:beta propeller repeat protein
VVLLDDADGDLSNGTPHLTEIAGAAAQHALFPFYSDTATVISDPDMTSILRSQGTVPVIGTVDPAAAYPGLVLQDYELFYGTGRNPASWTSFATGTNSVENGILGTWNFSGLPVGLYSLRLVARTTSGLSFQFVTKVGIEASITQLTTDPRWQYNPAISGRNVVWEDERGGPAGGDIWRRDLATGVESIVTQAVGNEWNPDIAGNLVVWEDHRSGSSGDIYMLDLSAPAERPIATGNWAQRGPGVSGNLIVWEDHEGGTPDVDLCELNPATGQCPERWSTNHAAQQFQPALSGNVVAWTDDRSGNLDVRACAYNPVTGLCPEFFVSANPDIQWYPHVSGPLMAWEDFRTDPGCQPSPWSDCDSSIYLRDAANGRTIAISMPGPQINPVVDAGRNIVAWAGISEENWDLFYCRYEPVSGACPVVQLTFDPGNQTDPSSRRSSPRSTSTPAIRTLCRSRRPIRTSIR